MRLWSLKRKSSESWVGKRRCIVSVEKYVKNILSKSRRTKSWKVERFHFVSFWISKSQKSWTVERFYFQCRKVEKLYKWKVPKGRATGIFIILSRNNLSLCYIWSCWVKFQPLIDEILTQNGSRSLGHPLWHSRESLKKSEGYLPCSTTPGNLDDSSNNVCCFYTVSRGNKNLFSLKIHFWRHLADQKICVICMPYRH